MSDALQAAFDADWQHAERARRAGDWARAFHHLERAHVLGQRRTRLHVKSHLGLWRIGWLRGDRREVFGQSTRLIAALLLSRVWVPVGNTGGANVSAFRPMPVPADLRAVLDAHGRARGRGPEP